MSGDWLKFEKATLDKPEVFAIAAATGLDPDAVVGKLLRVWSWFDTHTTTGNARSVTSALLDRISGVSGFADAMRDVGWLDADAAGVSLPNFDRHTGETAKNRALTAKRVAAHKEKGNAKGNAAGVTSPLPREEKRREEEKKKSGTRLPADWTLTPEREAYCRAKRTDLDPVAVHEDFCDYWRARVGPQALKADWDATWQTWVRKQHAQGAAVPATKKRNVW